jgi:hypothetical protein
MVQIQGNRKQIQMEPMGDTDPSPHFAICILLFCCIAYSSNIKTEAAGSSKTFITSYQRLYCYIKKNNFIQNLFAAMQ